MGSVLGSVRVLSSDAASLEPEGSVLGSVLVLTQPRKNIQGTGSVLGSVRVRTAYAISSRTRVGSVLVLSARYMVQTSVLVL